MRIAIDKAKQRFPDRPEPAQQEYAGEWVAWSHDRARIIAHGKALAQVRAEAIAAACQEPLMQRVLDTPFVGGS